MHRFRDQGYEATPKDVLDSFLVALGESGTLMLPLFNFDFTKGVPFSFDETPSHMGALTELGRAHPGAVRTGHPIYSFAVIGREAQRFSGVNNFSGYGPDSPFAMLRESPNGKIAVLDLPDQHSQTFYHHVEEFCDAPYRYHKEFTAPYRDSDGVEEERTYGLFVRNIEEGVLTHVDPTGELMWKRWLYSGFRPGKGPGLRIVRAQRMFDFVAGIISAGGAEGRLYRIEERQE